MTNNPGPAPRRAIEKLVAWRKAVDLAAKVHELAITFPRPDSIPLGEDLFAAAVRVATRIAIGHDSDEPGVFSGELSEALGALIRTEVHLLIAERLGFVTATTAAPVLARVVQLQRIVRGLRRAMDRRAEEQWLAECERDFAEFGSEGDDEPWKGPPRLHPPFDGPPLDED